MNTNKNLNNNSFESLVSNMTKKDKSVYSIKKTYPAFIVLLILLGISWVAYNYVNQQIANDRNQLYDEATGSVIKRFEQAYASNLQITNSMTGIYDQLFEVVRDYFELYGNTPVKTDPAVLSMIYAQKVSDEERGQYIHDVMSQGYWTYKIEPEGEREEYFPVQYIVPFDETTKHKHGFDLKTDDRIYKAIEKARDTYSATSTEFFPIREPDTLGFYIVMPIYKKDSPRDTEDERRANHQGAVLMEIESDLFFSGALGSTVASDTTIAFECFGLKDNGERYSIYKSKNYDQIPDSYIPVITSEYKLPHVDKSIIIAFKTSDTFGADLSADMPNIVLAMSTVLSFVFAILLFLILTSKERAEIKAKKISRSQTRITDSSKDIIATLSLDGVFVTANPAVSEILDISPEQLLGLNIKSLLLKENDRDFFGGLANTQIEEFTERFDFEVHRHGSNEESVWINWSFTVSKEDGYIYAIGRDVTEQILTAKRERIKSKEVEIAEMIANKSTAYIAHFMTELSHSIRNSLTGAIGYIELLQLGVYENEEEFNSYLDMAHESSQEIFNYIASIVDAALESYNSLLKEKRINDPELSDNLPELSVIPINELMETLNSKMKDIAGIDFDVNFNSDNPDLKVISYKESIDKILYDTSKLLAYNLDRLVLNINAEDNTSGGAILIQIMDEGNDALPDLIDIFRSNSSNLIKNIALDKDDVLLNFSKIKLQAEQIDCHLTVETFGKGDSNLVQLNIPLKGRMSGK